MTRCIIPECLRIFVTNQFYYHFFTKYENSARFPQQNPFYKLGDCQRTGNYDLLSV